MVTRFRNILLSILILSILSASSFPIASHLQALGRPNNVIAARPAGLTSTGLAARLSTIVIPSSSGPAWAKSYGVSGQLCNWGCFISHTSDGGFIIASSASVFPTFDIIAIKLDSNGNVQWSRQIGGAGINLPMSVAQTSDGGYIIAGYTNSFGAGSDDAWIVKLSPTGVIQWQKTYGGRSFDTGSSVRQTSDGGYIATATTGSFGAGSEDILVLKLDPQGSITWQKTYGGPGVESAESILQTSDGGYAVAGTVCTGSVCNPPNGFGSGEVDVWILRLDASGSVIWQKTYGGVGYDVPTNMEQSPDGGFIVGANSDSFGPYSSWIFKLDSAGNIVWQEIFSPAGTQHIKLTPDGGIIVAGSRGDFLAGTEDMWLSRLDGNGNTQWQKIYGGAAPGNDIAFTVDVALDGGYAFAGFTTSFGPGTRLLFIKTDPNGNIPGCSIETIFTGTTAPTSATITIPSVTGANVVTITTDSNAKNPRVKINSTTVC